LRGFDGRTGLHGGLGPHHYRVELGEASSDSRLGKLGSHSFGLKLGLNVLDNGELYLLAERYSQTGVNHPSTAIGDLKNQDLFSGVKATSMIVGYTFSFY